MKDWRDTFSEGLKSVRFEMPEGIPESFNEAIVNGFIERIKRGLKESAKVGIKANAVIIHKDLYYSVFTDYYSMQEVPVIFGLKVLCDDGTMPEDVEFMIFHGGNLPLTKDERIAKLEGENSELIGKLEAIRKLFESL